VEVTNVAPTAALQFPDTVNEEDVFTLELREAVDVSSIDQAAGLRFAFDCGDGTGWSAPGSQSSVRCNAGASGAQTVKGRVQDKDGGISEYSATITANSLPPTVAAPEVTPSPSDEGQSATISANFTPRGANNEPYTCAFNYGDGSSPVAGTVQNTTCTAPNHTYADNGSYPLVVTITNAKGASASSSATHTVENVSPLVGPIATPLAPNAVGAAVSANARFSDPGVQDTHTAVWNWGDGSSQAGTTSATSGGSEVTGSHSYTRAGVYQITLTVTDKDGGVGQRVSEYVVVYDPNGGFVTGGGWITSPAGAYLADQSASGRANFGFNSKYNQGATPSGETEFQLKVGDLNFHSNSYEWLVVNGTRAQYKGAGAINGQSGYGFLVTVVDGGAGGDMFRIKIWEQASGALIYDTQLGAPDSATPTLAISGGSIVVHAR
jgi:PKD repeat protein